MNQNNNRQNNERQWPWILGAVGAGAAAVTGAVALYLGLKNGGGDHARRHDVTEHTRTAHTRTAHNTAHQHQSVASSISSFFENVSMSNGRTFSSDKIRPNAAVSMNPQITNLNSLMSDIYVRFIQLKYDEFQLHYKVFQTIFYALHKTMKNIDPYYNQYASDVKFAGSHYDRLRIKRADEFDMDIVVSLPLNKHADRLQPEQSDIVVEASGAGFVQLRMGRQFRNLPLRDGAGWLVNRTAFQWGDDAGFLLRSKFIDWFKGVVDRALKQNNSTYLVDGAPYKVRRTESGPAVTIHVGNSRGFRLDVDLVPALKFPEQRWPVSRRYRNIPIRCRRGHWLLVPKPNKSVGALEQTRTWRIALHDQERELINNLHNCKQIIRLVKKLRDAQEMCKIASYYVKTLFLWEVVERDRRFWARSPAELFTLMVRRFHRAMLDGNIPYFWNRHNNLIAGVHTATLNGYAAKLQNLLKLLEQPAQYKRVAKFLLSRDEFESYNRLLNI